MITNLLNVYIVILNWNGLEDTLECLDSIQKITYPAVKVIVVDNASSNNQADIIAEKFPSAIVLKQSENLGFCGGCNVGIKYALENDADYVMLLNNDTLVATDFINQLFDGMKNLTNVGAVSPLIMWHPEVNDIWFSHAKWLSEKACFTLSWGKENSEKLKDKEPYSTEFACGCCLFASAEIFQKEGLLDERYFAFYDEAEWCARIKRKGFEFYVIPKAKIFHKGSRSTPGLVSTYLMTRNRMLWMKENLTFRKRVLSFPFLVKDFLGQLLNLSGLTKEHLSKAHSRAIIKGYQDYFLGKFYKWDKKTEKLIFPKA